MLFSLFHLLNHSLHVWHFIILLFHSIWVFTFISSHFLNCYLSHVSSSSMLMLKDCFSLRFLNLKSHIILLFLFILILHSFLPSLNVTLVIQSHQLIFILFNFVVSVLSKLVDCISIVLFLLYLTLLIFNSFLEIIIILWFKI